MRVETAIKMIQEHGHKAFVTAEGLACVCEAVQSRYGMEPGDKVAIAFLDDDCVFEEVTTFPILRLKHMPEHVNADHLRNWLGY